jgi:flagellar motor switch protein FliM
MSDLQLKKNKSASNLALKTGIRALVDNSLFSYDKSLDLKKSLNQFRISLVNAFSKIASEQLKCTLADPTVERFTKAENSGLFKGAGEIFLPFSSKSFQFYGCIGIDENLVFYLVECLLGNHGPQDLSVRERSISEEPLTLIERVVVKKIAQIILNAFQEGLFFVPDTHFVIGEVEQNFSIDKDARSGAILYLPLRIDSDRCKGSLSITITFNQKQFSNSKNENLSTLENSKNVAALIKDVVFSLEGTICDKNFKNLSELLKLKIGETLILEHNTDKDIFLRCENFTIAQGKVGEFQKNIAVKVTQMSS